MEEVNDPRSSAADIANVISSDPGLAARVLRIANSALYCCPSTVDILTGAVTMIGTEQVVDLALATSVRKLFQGIPSTLVSMDSFWRHSIACGLLARILATFRRETNVERFFVSGLLHDVGRLVIYSELPEQARGSLNEAEAQSTLLYLKERELMGFDHAAVAGALLALWRLPQHIVDAVTYHHNPSAAQHSPTDVSIVHVADVIANAMQMGSSGERYVPPLDTQAWEHLALADTVLSLTFTQFRRQYHDVLRVFLYDT